MRMIMGKSDERKSEENIRAGEVIEFTSIAPEEGVAYSLKATGDVVEVNPGKMIQFPGTIWVGELAPEDCTVRYMTLGDETTVTVHIKH